MKTGSVICVSILMSINLYSQEEILSKKELRKIIREDKISTKIASRNSVAEETRLLLYSHRFVLEANFVSDLRTNKIPVNSTLNFIAIDSTESLIQLGSPFGMGYNGLGGITINGKISNYKLNENKGKRRTTYTLMINILTSIGTYTITFLISESGYADATISGNTSGRLIYSGKLTPIGKSRVYKGTGI